MTLAQHYLSFSAQAIITEDTKNLLDIRWPWTDFTGKEEKTDRADEGGMNKKYVVIAAEKTKIRLERSHESENDGGTGN